MLSILIKPASGNCNMECEYCFYESTKEFRKENSDKRMSLETLENIVKKAFDFDKEGIAFAFQGGEPTLVGLDFYKEFIKFKDKYNKNNISVNMSMQTNGYNIDEKWAEFFKKENFLVGLSIDGPRYIHNKYRTLKDGKGTFDDILKAKKILDEKGVQYNVLTVINSGNYFKAKDIYNFYKKNKIFFVQFIPCLDSGFEQTGNHSFSLKPSMYEMFLKEFFDLWYEDYKRGSAISVRLFENICAMMLGMMPESCEFMGKCSIQNVIESDGSIYPCDFYVTQQNELGNINEIEFEDIPKSKPAIRFVETESPLNKCKTCKYGILCKGGCKRYRDISTQEYYYCNTFINFYDYTIDRFIKICKDIVKREKKQ